MLCWLSTLPFLRARDEMEEWDAWVPALLLSVGTVGTPGVPAFPVPCTGSTCRLYFSRGV